MQKISTLIKVLKIYAVYKGVRVKGFLMQNTKGIILNGEWLGNNVVVNDMFNAICSVSPIAMQEFLHLVNDIDELDNAIIINDFSYNNKNLLDINFSNSDIRGIASLLFKMDGSRQRLLNCFFKIDSIDSDMADGDLSKSKNREKFQNVNSDGKYENFSSEEKSYMTSPEFDNYSNDGYDNAYDNYDKDDENGENGEYYTDDNYNSYNEERERVIGRKRSNKPRRRNRTDYYDEYDNYDEYDDGYDDDYYEEDDYEGYDDESEPLYAPRRPRRKPKKRHIHTDRRPADDYDAYDYEEEDYEEEDYEDYREESESLKVSHRKKKKHKAVSASPEEVEDTNEEFEDYEAGEEDEEDEGEESYETSETHEAHRQPKKKLKKKQKGTSISSEEIEDLEEDEEDYEDYREESESLKVPHRKKKKHKTAPANPEEVEDTDEESEDYEADEEEDDYEEEEESDEVSRTSGIRRQPKKRPMERRRRLPLSHNKRDDLYEDDEEDENDEETKEDAHIRRPRREQMRPRSDMRDSDRNDIEPGDRRERPPRSRADKDLGMDYKELIIRANNINITCDGGNIPEALMNSGMVSTGGGYSGSQMPSGGGYGGQMPQDGGYGGMPQGGGYGSGQMPQGGGYGGGQMPPNMGNWPGMWNGPGGQGPYPNYGNPQDMSLMDEIHNLKTELMNMSQQGAQGAGGPVKKERMTLEEYMEQQRSKESKANEYSEGFRIIGSKKRLKVDALDNNFFVADNKVYKWGEKRTLNW